MAGFNAQTFTESRDKEIALVMLRAYNHWAIDEWAGAYPARPCSSVFGSLKLASTLVRRVSLGALPVAASRLSGCTARRAGTGAPRRDDHR